MLTAAFNVSNMNDGQWPMKGSVTMKAFGNQKRVSGSKNEAKTAVAKTETTAVSTELDYGGDVGQGFENLTSADLTIPFIQVLQTNSPQVKKPKDGGVEGASAGMMINTVTNDLFDGDEGMLFVPVSTEHIHIEWKSRKAGGGFVKIHGADSPDVIKKGKTFGKYLLDNGNELAETFQFYAIILDSAGQPLGPAVISFASTKIKAYKDMMTRLNSFTIPTPAGRKSPPLFANRLKMTTFADKNEQGDFYNVRLDSAADSLKDGLIPPNDPLYKVAKDFRDMVIGGQVKVDHAKVGAGGDEEGGEPPF